MKIIRFCLFSLLFIGCRQAKKSPDVSGIPMKVQIERFDRSFFAIDSNRVSEGLLKVAGEYPYFIQDFIVNILGTSPLYDTSRQAFAICRSFLTSYLPVKDSLEQKYADLRLQEEGLKEGFRHIKYYFPTYNLPPRVVAFIGPFDAPGVALTRYTLAIGLQLYAGRSFSFYLSNQGQELFPLYISRRFEKEYIVPNCIKALAEDMYPDRSQGKALIEQMIEKGKSWWLGDLLMPDTPDSLKTGFTQKQLDWCLTNEGSIWNYFLDQNLYSPDPDLIKNFIGDAPNTQGMPDTSPGNIGQWVGWRIVQKYASMHPDMPPSELMNKSAKAIFEEAKYKPK